MKFLGMVFIAGVVILAGLKLFSRTPMPYRAQQSMKHLLTGK